MKQRIWIVIILLMCTCMICFGAYRLCTREDNEYKESRNPHYTGLDIVLAPPAVESKEYDYTGFKVSFNRHNRTPNWVAWELLGSETRGEAKRHNRFWQDRDVDGCPTTNDYRNSGYDRGHM